MWAQFFIEGIFTPLLGIFGVVGNLVSIKVLSSRDLDMMPSFRHLLKMLAGFDANFLVFTLTLFCISSWSHTYDKYYRPWLTPYMLPIIQISLTGSVWTTMAVSVERYMTVCLSYRSQFFANCNNNYHFAYTVPIVASSLIFNIPRFFELRTEMKMSNFTYYNSTLENYTTEERLMPALVPTEIRKDPTYTRDYVLIANSMALVFFPILILIILNSFIFRTIRKATQRHNAISSHQRRDHSVTMMLMFIVVVFVICHSIRSIINTFECAQLFLYGELRDWPDWIQTLVHINHFALVVNSSINIVIYCWRDEKFLDIMLITMRLRDPHGSSSSSSGGRGGRRCRVVIEETTRNGPDVMTKLNGIEDNGGEMKEMKPIINHSQHSRHSSINTTCLSEASHHISITNESPKIVLSGGPKHLQNHHHHHRHHKHKPQQQQQMVSNGQAGDGSTIMVEMTPCNQTHSNENQPLVPNCQGLCDQKKQEVPDFCVDDAESSRCSCDASSCESQSSASNHEDEMSTGVEEVPVASMTSTKVAAATQVP